MLVLLWAWMPFPISAPAVAGHGLCRPGARVLRSVGWVSIGMAIIYVFNAYVVYLHG